MGCRETFSTQGWNLSPFCLLVLEGGFFTTGATWEATCCFLRSCCCSALPLHVPGLSPHIHQCQLSTSPCRGRWLPTPSRSAVWLVLGSAFSLLLDWLHWRPGCPPTPTPAHGFLWTPLLQSSRFSQAHSLVALRCLAPPSHPSAPCRLSLGSLGHCWCPA